MNILAMDLGKYKTVFCAYNSVGGAFAHLAKPSVTLNRVTLVSPNSVKETVPYVVGRFSAIAVPRHLGQRQGGRVEPPPKTSPSRPSPPQRWPHPLSDCQRYTRSPSWPVAVRGDEGVKCLSVKWSSVRRAL